MAHSSGTALSAPRAASLDCLPGRHLAFGIVTLALLMMSIDQTSIAIALSTLQDDLGTTLAWAGWTVTAYSVGSIVALPVAGRLCEQLGRRRVFLGAVAMFTVTAALCALALNIEQLVLLRVVQGLAGGAFLPSATGIVADRFGSGRDRAIALFTSVFPIGAIIGPVVGGLLLAWGGWRTIFLVNVPIGLAVLVGAALIIREPPRTAGSSLDGMGIALLVTALLGGMYAVSRTGSLRGAVDVVTALVAGGVAIAAAATFVRHARRHPAPVVPIRLLRGGGFGTMNAVNLLFGAASLGLAALVPTYAQVRYDIPPLVAGGLLTLRAVGVIGASGVAVLLLRRLGFRPLLLGGFVVQAVGLVMVAVPPAGLRADLWLAVATGITGVGLGMSAPAAGNAAMHLAPDEVTSVAGLRSMFRQFGGIMGISVTTAVATASAHPATAQALAFVVLAVVLLAAIPLAARLPNRRGRW